MPSGCASSTASGQISARPSTARPGNSCPPADYKLACHLPTGRSAFTFCVCPGGEVVAAASAQGQVVTNGMSFRARDGKNINGGFLVGVGPEDFPAGAGPAGRGALPGGVGAGGIPGWGAAASCAPAQRVEDFLDRSGPPRDRVPSGPPTAQE